MRATHSMSDLKGRFWLCQKCGKHVPARLEQCVCGFSRAGLEDVPVEPALSAATPEPATREWFVVGPAKLVVMSVITLGLYQVYWFYQQWRRVRDGGEDIWPLPRSLFGVIFCHSLFQRIVRSAPATARAGAGPGALAVAYILLCVSSRLPLPFALAALLSVLPLVSVQRLVNEMASPDEDPNRRLTGANWLLVALAGGLGAFVAYAALTREKPTSLEFLTKVAEEINRTKQATTDGVTLDRAVALPGTLVYHYRVSDEMRPVVEERRPVLKDSVKPSVCRDRLLKAGVSVRFVYSDQAGQEIAAVDVSPQDCGSPP